MVTVTLRCAYKWSCGCLCGCGCVPAAVRVRGRFHAYGGSHMVLGFSGEGLDSCRSSSEPRFRTIASDFRKRKASTPFPAEFPRGRFCIEADTTPLSDTSIANWLRRRYRHYDNTATILRRLSGPQHMGWVESYPGNDPSDLHAYDSVVVIMTSCRVLGLMHTIGDHTLESSGFWKLEEGERTKGNKRGKVKQVDKRVNRMRSR